MKKQINIYISLFFFTLAVLGCSDDFLNDPTPTADVSKDIIFDSRESAETLLTGIHRNFRDQFLSDVTTSQEIGGVYAIYMARTLKGNDFIQRDTWYANDYDNNNRDASSTRVRFSWEFPYYLINQVNTLINGVTESTIAESDKKELIAQGKAIRAFFYFQLAMEFQHTYSYDSSLPAPPIYTELSLVGKPMSTLGELYDFIIDDLQVATADLDETRLRKSYINKQVAAGVLARVYLVTENWVGAKDAAIIAYGGDPSTVLDAGSYGNGFDAISNIEWIWGNPQTKSQTNSFYLAPHAFTDFNNPSWNATFVNTSFAALFSNTDVRKLFENPYEDTVPEDWEHVSTTKFAFAVGSDIPLMRTAEMILIEAEAKHRLLDPTAHDLLFALQSNRDPSAVKSSNTGAALLEEILVERRKELYAEIGVEWFDAKRLRRAIPRTGNHRLLNSDLAADDKKFFLKIPQREIDANDNIDASVNNGR
tara:strand:+ start:40549 stop:41985 length:1437 start_codon:yes stop_codon:yes gene_type:complete